jgi:HPt (histidine-containing phosphotransfer) domain-containing protein
MTIARIFMYLLLLQLGGYSPLWAEGNTPTTVKTGEIDLSAWDKAQPLRLTGDWYFFPREHISPQHFVELWQNHPERLTTAPSGQRFMNIAPAHFKDDFGIASYALVLHQVPPGQLALEGASIYTSARLQAFTLNDPNGSLVRFEIGEAGLDREHSRPLTARDNLLPLRTSPQETWVILIHASNFHHSWGGLWLAPRIGDYYELSQHLKLQDKLNYWLLGVIFFLAVYSISLYMRRPEDRPRFFLAIFSIFLCIRLLAIAEAATPLIPDSAFKFEMTFKIIYGTMIIGPMTLLYFTNSCFPDFVPKGWIKGLTLLFSLPLIAIGVTSASFYGQLSDLLKIISLFVGFNGIFILVRAVWARHPGAVISLSGIGCVVIGAMLDVLNSYGFHSLPQNSTAMGMSVCIICQSQIVALRFASAFRRSEHLSRELQSEVEKQTRDIKSILAHIRQGIFTISTRDKKIDELHSEYLKELTHEPQMKGQSLRSLILDRARLTEEEKSLTESSLDAALGEDPVGFELNAANLVQELEFVAPGSQEACTLQIDWNPMLSKEHTVEKVLVSIRDVTKLRKLEAQTRRQEEDMNVIMELIQIPEDRFHRFIEKTLAYLQENRSIIQDGRQLRTDVIKRLFVNMHTIKGAARTYYLGALSNASHEAEQYYAALQKDETLWDAARLFRDLERVEAVVEHYRFVSQSRLGWQSGNQSVRISRRDIEDTLDRLGRLESMKLNKAALDCLHESREFLLKSCSTALPGVIDECCRGMDSMARDLGKATPIVALETSSVMLKDRGADLLHSLLTHLLRNSLDHGFESTDERLRKGKPAQGRIHLATRVSAPYFYFHYRDDGQGLDLLRLEAIGKERGLLPLRYGYQDVAELIFRSGLSTKDAVSEFSGRGVGLDAVRSYLEEVGGSVQVLLESVSDPAHVPFTLIMALPLDLCFVTNTPAAESFDVAG